MRRLIYLALFGALACGSKNPNTATVVGAVGGLTLDAKDAIFAALVLDDGQHHDAVLVTDYGNACSQSRDNMGVPNGTSLLLALTQKDGNGALEPVTSGEFPIGAADVASRSARAFFQKNDETCAETLDAAASQALGGSVTVTGSDSEFIDGTFDLQMPAGDHLQGKFHAAICAEPTRKVAPVCRVE